MPQPKIFISYSPKDRTDADVLHKNLVRHGFVVWRDQENLYGGQQWPKAIGEAIAAADFFLLLWSSNSTTSHFVEFEWTTAIALRKPIIPCLIDNASLPSSLTAVHGIPMENIEAAMPKLIAALGITIPAAAMPIRVSDVLTELGQIQTTDPSAVVSQARVVFARQGWTVQGNVYQASGDIFVTVQPNEEKAKSKIEPYKKFLGLIVAILTIFTLIFTLSDKIKGIFLPTTTPLRGIVFVITNGQQTPVDGATIKVENLVGKQVMTTNDGSFYFPKVPGNSGDRVRVYVSKPGYRDHNEYAALPGPIRIQLQTR